MIYLGMLIGIAVGVIATVFFYSRDPSIAHLKENECIVKQPEPGHTLVQVTPQLLRRMYSYAGEEVEGKKVDEAKKVEARHLYQRVSKRNKNQEVD